MIHLQIIEVVCAKEELDGKITTPVPQQSYVSPVANITFIIYIDDECFCFRNVKLKGKKAKEAKRKAKLESGSTSNVGSIL